jgi:DNA replication protein DnaC
VPLARRDETLAAFKPVAGTREALAAAREVVWGGLRWLLLYGGVGSGKSHLAHGIVLASVETGRRARLVNALVLLSELRAVSGGPAQSTMLRDLATVPLLAIDDFIWATDIEARWLEEIVQRRYQEKRPLVVTTNRDVKDLPAPLVSRFWELGKVVLNRGKDFRRRAHDSG